MEYELSGAPGFALGTSAIPKTHCLPLPTLSVGPVAPQTAGVASLLLIQGQPSSLQRGEAAVPGEMLHDFF